MAYMSPVIKLAGKNPDNSIFIITFFILSSPIYTLPSIF